ncbi:hypothetical protein [Thiolapillus sp.]|uniref:hypothetical protein n=1 Tax=Thiolapillus sp. TaxID=2017437 RepID=UPI0025EB5A48|nr:hypothetical protein [Thiolapillus sp.]
MTRMAGAQIGCQRLSRFWGLGCPKIYHEAEDTLGCRLLGLKSPGRVFVNILLIAVDTGKVFLPAT